MPMAVPKVYENKEETPLTLVFMGSCGAGLQGLKYERLSSFVTLALMATLSFKVLKQNRPASGYDPQSYQTCKFFTLDS